MKNGSSVLVIVPVMNRPDAIITTLEAIRKQTLQPSCLIVVDDGSTDNTPNVVRSWINNSALAFRVRLIEHSQNKGASEARNSGLKHSLGKYAYTYFLDSDDIPPPNFLAKAITALTNNPAAVAVTSDRIIKYISGVKSVQYKQRKIAENPWLWFLMMGAGIASCTVFRSEAIHKLGGYNETLPTGHDVELFMRIADLGEWLHINDCEVTFYRLESRLSDRYFNRHIIWCLIFENSVLISTALKHIPFNEYRRILAHRWRRAGQIMLANGCFTKAKDCFRRSLGWRLFNKAIIDLFWFYPIKRLRFLLPKLRIIK